ncbi:MAG: MAPEG family protein [Rudaea sp.]|uniref:MAPEG family protein n=1 Tax=Rudaea sp. TaxID=2136325 RepID=UPI0039E43272
MDARLIFWPAVALVLLTFVVQVRMFLARTAEIRRERIPLREIATSAQLYARLRDVQAADNFRNLFELPVVFYLGVVIAFLTAQVNALTLALAWTFVVSRIAHSYIHCTSNRVRYRFYAYAFGVCVMWVFWAALACGLLK